MSLYIMFNYLRKAGLVFLITIFPLSLFAENPIPNTGFENWSGDNPVDWFTNNLAGAWTPVTQSGSSHSGNYAAKLEVVDFQGVPVFPGLQSMNMGFPVSEAYANFSGYYLFDPAVPSNVLNIAVFMRKNSIVMGQGIIYLSSPQVSYTQFNVPIGYFSSEVPDTAWISITLADTLSNLTTGGTALFDDLELNGSATGITDNGNTVPSRFKLEQNYPNPFNPTTTIEFSIPETALVQLVVYNQLGERVAGLVNGNLVAGVHRVEWQAGDLPSGVYFYKLTAGKFSDTKKFILLK